jgi:hypothetical protein
LSHQRLQKRLVGAHAGIACHDVSLAVSTECR